MSYECGKCGEKFETYDNIFKHVDDNYSGELVEDFIENECEEDEK